LKPNILHTTEITNDKITTALCNRCKKPKAIEELSYVAETPYVCGDLGFSGMFVLVCAECNKYYLFNSSNLKITFSGKVEKKK